MGNEDSKRNGDSASGKVIQLSCFQKAKSPEPNHLVFYISENARWADTFSQIPALSIRSIQSQAEFNTEFTLRLPELILIEAGTEWSHPLNLISEARRLMEIPVILLCDGRKTTQQKSLIKDAYSLGIHDVLFPPFQREDIFETLQLILKLQVPHPVMFP